LVQVVLAWCRYALNVGFNLLNKTIFNYFPYPYTVSAVHVCVGLAYCTVAYILGAKKASFGRVRTLAMLCISTLQNFSHVHSLGARHAISVHNSPPQSLFHERARACVCCVTFACLVCPLPFGFRWIVTFSCLICLIYASVWWFSKYMSQLLSPGCRHETCLGVHHFCTRFPIDGLKWPVLLHWRPVRGGVELLICFSTLMLCISCTLMTDCLVKF
jgi:Triose-phosphate Transporter family